MAELCIVCLGDLRSSTPTNTLPETAEATSTHDGGCQSKAAKNNSKSSTESIHTDAEAIAHLLPCKHELHHACLKPWVERANSCPICRATFNMVELSVSTGGPVIDSYAVQDKVQEVEVDPTMVVEDELFAVEAWEPCLVCGANADLHEFMYCDGCDKAVHVFCAGFEDSPDVWYCEKCLLDLETDVGIPGMASAMNGRTRRRTMQSRGRSRGSRRNNSEAVWARVWQEVSRRLDLDLDFPFDEESHDYRTEEQRREFARWQRRFEVANRQGAANRLREIADTQIRPIQPAANPTDPESQEELRAWNAFEKARESQDAPSSLRRKRKATASPASPQEPEPVSRAPQKRPRLRRPRVSTSQQVAESSSAAAHRGNDEPTFLSSLLREVEVKPAHLNSPGTSDHHQGHHTPTDGSPAASPTPSTYGTPRASSATPPPQALASPQLSSIAGSISSPLGATFSPFSPVSYSPGPRNTYDFHQRVRRRPNGNGGHDEEHHNGEQTRTKTSVSPVSPTRLSYSAKEEVQRMVKLALGSRYRDKEISKEQYTDINRAVSRKLYDLVADAAALSNQAERERWQVVADEEVGRAISALALGSPAAEENPS